MNTLTRPLALSALLLASLIGGATAARAQLPPLHALTAPCIDPRYVTAVPWGAHSLWLQPWRAYAETVSAQRFLDAQGVVLNGRDDDNFDLVCQMRARNGIRHARIGEGWGEVNETDETRLNNTESLRKRLLTCRRRGIRPLILLNANSGAPGPTRFFDRALAAPARKGHRRVELADTTGLVAGYSGFQNITDNGASEVIVTGIKGNGVTLSKPLPKDRGATGAKVGMTTLKYRPFGPPETPEYRATRDGWKRYVDTVARTVSEIPGTTGKADQGFDMEIWNELSLGSSFLTINSYYDPKFATDDENAVFAGVVKATVEAADARPDQFRGVRFVNGLRNTNPWPTSSTEPPRVSAMIAHPYAGRYPFAKSEQRPRDVNALLQEEQPGFVPTYSANFPEHYGTLLQTETVLRDMGPITTRIGAPAHGRNARMVDGTVVPCPLWFTEIGFAPLEHGITDRAAALALKAKTAARYECFFIGKGLERIYFFSAFSGDTDLGVVQDDFIAYARSHTAYPADDSAYTSPMLRVIGRMTTTLRDGVDPALIKTRAIQVESIADRHDHFQFAGDGTPAHPNLGNRDVLAVLPFQVNARKFIIAYYVLTRDVTRTLPPEKYTVRLSGLRGKHATLRVYDPLTDKAVPLTVDAAGSDSLTVTLAAGDAPCLSIVQEP